MQFDPPTNQQLLNLCPGPASIACSLFATAVALYRTADHFARPFAFVGQPLIDSAIRANWTDQPVDLEAAC